MESSEKRWREGNGENLTFGFVFYALEVFIFWENFRGNKDDIHHLQSTFLELTKGWIRRRGVAALEFFDLEMLEWKIEGS